jgi:3-oxoacyl-[acyl-carrier-protein] synthase III
MRARISGTGSYVPAKVLTNADLERMVATSDEWIVERTGIRERHVASPGEACSDLAIKAADRRLSDSCHRLFDSASIGGDARSGL